MYKNCFSCIILVHVCSLLMQCFHIFKTKTQNKTISLSPGSCMSVRVYYSSLKYENLILIFGYSENL